MIFRFFHRLLMPLLAIFLISGTVDAQAQFLPGLSGSETKSDASALKSLIDEAQQNGSTVIVVSPPNVFKQFFKKTGSSHWAKKIFTKGAVCLFIPVSIKKQV